RLKQEPSLPADAQRVVAVPDVVQTFAEPGDILFLACDGMFEARGMTWSGVAALLKESLEELRGDLPRVAYKLLDSAFTR
ncbi:protein phosphatase 2C domain-containing protein, partial [Toxoplasma gondii ARI]